MPFDFVFEVVWFRAAEGAEVAKDELTAVTRSNPQLANRVRAALEKLPDGRWHREPHTKDIGDGLHEVRIEGRVDVRILFTYRPGRRVVVLHAFAKKSQQIPPGNRSAARRRLLELLRRSE